MADVIANTEVVTETVVQPEVTSTAADRSKNGSTETKTAAEYEAEIIRLKAANDKLCASEGNLRKQLKSKMSAEEANAAAKAEHEEYVASLEKQVAVMRQTSLLVSKGFTESEATQIAEARYSGDIETATDLENAHYDAIQKRMEDEYNAKLAKLMNPTSGNGNSVDYNQIIANAMENGDKLTAIKAIREQANFQINH